MNDTQENAWQNFKVCGPARLSELIKAAHDIGLNRQGPADLANRLAPTGRNILHRVLMYHQAFDRSLPQHHRAIVLAKVRFKTDPVEFTLDITDDDWNLLESVPDELLARPE